MYKHGFPCSWPILNYSFASISIPCFPPLITSFFCKWFAFPGRPLLGQHRLVVVDSRWSVVHLRYEFFSSRWVFSYFSLSLRVCFLFISFHVFSLLMIRLWLWDYGMERVPFRSHMLCIGEDCGQVHRMFTSPRPSLIAYAPNVCYRLNLYRSAAGIIR